MPQPGPSPRRVRSPHESRSAAVRAAAAAPSHRQRSHWQRQQRQNRVLLFAAVVLGAIVLAILAGGWYIDNVVDANALVASVEGEDITARQLLDAVRPYASAVDDFARQLGGGSRSGTQAQQLDQQKRSLPDSALQSLVQQRIMEHEAARRGISVTQQDVDDDLRKQVAAYEARISATPEPTTERTPTSAATATPAGTPTPFATPTQAPTLEAGAYPEALKQFVDAVNQSQVGRGGPPVNEQVIRVSLYQQLLAQRLQDAMGAEVPTSQEQVHARVIRLTDQQKASDLLQQLKNGADFAELAKQSSVDTTTKDKGGDLGWIVRGSESDAFDAAAFALQPGQLSDVVADSGSYEIIQVLERDPNRPLTPDQLDAAKQKAFSDWFSEKETSPEVRRDLSQSERDWVLRRIGVRP